jgi:hypothetical protein
VTKGTTSPRQVLVGVVLGIFLLPLPLILEFAYFHGTEGTMNPPFQAVLYFGMIQAFTILPASLCFYLIGKHGVVRGLLYFGTFAALSNVLLWIFAYRGFFAML